MDELRRGKGDVRGVGHMRGGKVGHRKSRPSFDFFQMFIF
jgi:hypothetical protein